MSLRRGLVVAAVLGCGGVSGWAQSKGATTPPVLQSGDTTVTVNSVLTKDQQKQLLATLDKTFQFVSKDTGLPIVHPIKSKFTSRDEVNKMLRKPGELQPFHD